MNKTIITVIGKDRVGIIAKSMFISSGKSGKYT